jgi:flagellar motor switch protein FliM
VNPEESSGPPTIPAMPVARRAWRPFSFAGRLEKVSRMQISLLRQLEWLFPGITETGTASEAVSAKLNALFEEQAKVVVDYVQVSPPSDLRKYLGEPTFLATLAPLPHKRRGLLEIELGLAHSAIDMLLGGGADPVALRPLTDIEEGIICYVILEMLKAISPAIDPGLPRFRLEGVCHTLDDAMALVAEEQQVAVVQMRSIWAASPVTCAGSSRTRCST